MKDSFNREINYLRVSVTDRCNLRCRYCMPEQGILHKSHSEILSYEEMLSIIRVCALMGINRIRLTGGEPLIRKDIMNFIYKIREIKEIKEVNITTNGLLLAHYAQDLKKIGINSINISLDSLNAEKYKYITRGGNLNEVLKGVNKALEVGLEKIKINSVIIKGFNDDEIMDFVNLTKEKPVYVRFIELMPIGEALSFKNKYVSSAEIMYKLPKMKEVLDSRGSGPAKYYAIEGYKGFVGFIDSISQCFCKECNRIRLTADGKLMPCLHSNIQVDLREVLKNGAINELMKMIKQGLALKPKSHKLNLHNKIESNSDNERYMSQIGG